MKQERYGARLCWSVHVKDPAATFFGKIAAAKTAIKEAARTDLPPQPIEPTAPPTPDAPTSTQRVTQIVTSPLIDADRWGFWGDQRAEYDADIDIPQGWSWDGDLANVRIRLDSLRPHSTISNWIVGRPYPVDGGKLRARVHIGAPVWMGGPRIHFQVDISVYQDVTITEKAAQDTKYFDDLATYRTALKEWNDMRDKALAAARVVAAEEAELLAILSPINEMIAQIVEQSFPAAVRDEMWEIDYWQSLFDWERATFVAYPGWWSSSGMRDPLLDPSDFVNASWAKLYLPVRLGQELAALRWIFGKSIDTPLGAELEAALADTVKDLEDYRRSEFGAAGELEELTRSCQPVKDLSKCMASWSELIPTDGTHLEVVQGVTSAADAVTAREITDAEAMRAALLAGESSSTTLKDKAETMMTGDADVHVGIGVDRPVS